MQFSRQLIQKSKLLRYPIRYPLYSSMYCFQSYSRIQATSYPFNNNIINNNNFMHNQRLFCAAAADLTDEAILERIRKVLSTMERAKLDENDPLTAETNVFEKLGLDSLDFVEFGIALEDEFQCEIDDDAAENIKTIGDAIKLIKESKQAKAE